MINKNSFYTMKGYVMRRETETTAAMEDYIEMISRLSVKGGGVRVNELARMLHVRASSVTKMVQHLAGLGYIDAEKYHEIVLTEKGRAAGEYLLYRHGVIHRFLCALNRTDNELEQVEKIEHFLDDTTVRNLEKLTDEMLK